MEEERHLLDQVSSRTGHSMAELNPRGVQLVYRRSEDSLEDDLTAIREACGAWRDRSCDGESYVEALRPGQRLVPECW